MKFLKYLLIPFSLVYFLITQFRNFLFDCGFFKAYKPAIPVLVIGNLSVGGTGKTPHTIFLIKCLTNQKKIIVVSRGYGRKSLGLKQVKENGNPSEYGDEPIEIKNRFPSLNVIVSNSRKEAIKFIEVNFPQTELIILDDGFQHRWVKPSCSVLLTKCSSPFSSDFLLPFGNLRESATNSKRADVVIVTKASNINLNKDNSIWYEKLNLNSPQRLFFSELKYNNELYSITSNSIFSIQQLNNINVFLFTSID